MLIDCAVHTSPAQHPVAHEVESQTHAPATQRCPAAHEGALPHWQLPPAAQVSASSGSHATHAEPPEPQPAGVAVTQLAPLQQPGQLFPLHAPPVHTPPVQVWPGAHEGLLPQRQLPPDEQRSALLASQATHVSPPIPQVVKVRLLQTSPSQHPEGQEVASHVHFEPAQRWPGPQEGPGPHWQPLDVQLSVSSSRQVAHAPPAGPPQLASDSALQVCPEQQPLALGHEFPSQTQPPPTQCWPTLQLGPEPH